MKIILRNKNNSLNRFLRKMKKQQKGKVIKKFNITKSAVRSFCAKLHLIRIETRKTGEVEISLLRLCNIQERVGDFRNLCLIKLKEWKQ